MFDLVLSFIVGAIYTFLAERFEVRGVRWAAVICYFVILLAAAGFFTALTSFVGGLPHAVL